ncbi:hypothetical protein [Ralstonia syzygii]|uniref:GntR C-terminal domain-containing protein n=1 Tax=Ralstonia syzygii R24 TaxID=907261 RepID=G2ZZA8_9RALS|nr:hypothetical protein [Ralstonia syzygii]CCA84205.1 hypothetical protein RALSY_10167 [Ralstonia syzygii R24]
MTKQYAVKATTPTSIPFRALFRPVNTRLVEHYKLAEQQVRLHINIGNTLMGSDLEDIVDRHRPMMDALLRSDGMKAAHEAWAHNESEGGKLVAFLQQRA